MISENYGKRSQKGKEHFWGISYEEVIRSCFILLPLVAGMILAYQRILHAESMDLFLLGELSFFLIVLLSGASLLSHARMIEGIVVLGTEVFIVFFLLRGNLLRGIGGILNLLIQQWNFHHEDGVALWKMQQVTQADINTAAFFGFVLILTVFYYRVRGQKMLLLTLLLFFLLLFEGILGYAPVGESACFLIAIAEMQFRIEGKVLDRRRLLWSGCIVVILMILVTTSKPAGALRKTKGYMQERFERIIYGHDQLPQGNLYEADELHRDDSKKVRLSVQVPSDKDIYLRGFIGDQYRDGKWMTFSGNIYGGRDSGMIDWLKKQGFTPAAQYQAYVEADGNAASSDMMQVENIHANRKYIYAPYSAEALSDRRIHSFYDNGYRSVPILALTKYSYQDRSDNLPSELLRAADWIQEPDDKERSSYMEAERVYRDFVYRHYLDVDKDLQRLIHRAFHASEEKGDLGIYEATVKIRNVLEEVAGYEASMPAIPENEEPIRYFLTKTGCGNEAMYASVSVQAFRSFGIPARYVEGYYIAANREESKVKSLELTDQNAHVWCEVYMDGMGWMPIDTTPGYYYDTYAMIHLMDAHSEVRQTSGQEEGNEGAEQILAEQDANRRKMKERLRKVGHALYGILVLVMIVFVNLLLLGIFIRYVAVFLFNRRLKNATQSEIISLRWRRIRHSLGLLGIECRMGWEIENTEEKIREVIPSVTEGEFVFVNEMMEKRYYGEQELEKHESAVIYRFYDKVMIAMIGLRLFQRLRFYVTDTCFILFWSQNK